MRPRPELLHFIKLRAADLEYRAGGGKTEEQTRHAVRFRDLLLRRELKRNLRRFARLEAQFPIDQRRVRRAVQHDEGLNIHRLVRLDRQVGPVGRPGLQRRRADRPELNVRRIRGRRHIPDDLDREHAVFERILHALVLGRIDVAVLVQIQLELLYEDILGRRTDGKRHRQHRQHLLHSVSPSVRGGISPSALF